MKTTFKMLMTLGLGVAVMLLSGCGENGSVDSNQTEPVVVNTTCTLEQGVPTGYSMGVMHENCSGEKPINSATVTVDGVIKPVDFVANSVSLDDYMSFYNLDPDTTYTAELNVVVDGEPLDPVFANLVTGSVETPAPTPDPTPDPTPQEQCESAGGFWNEGECFY